MKVLVINAGSSSLKYQFIKIEEEKVLAKGLCERIGIDGSKLTLKVPGKDDYVVEELILCTIMENNEKLGVIKEIIYNNGNDLLLVEGIKKFYIPLKGNYIEKVDLENNIVYTKNAKDLILWE